MSLTHYVVVPFGRDEDGNLVRLESIKAKDSVAAGGQARAAATRHGGAIAFSLRGGSATGGFADAKIIRTIGVVDEKLLGE